MEDKTCHPEKQSRAADLRQREMEVQLSDGPHKFLVEEHINALVDRLERRLQSKKSFNLSQGR